jgi:uncharacterized protein (DUF58 family)
MEIKDSSPLIIGLCLLVMGLATGGIVFYAAFTVTVLVIALDLCWLKLALSGITRNYSVRFDMPRHEWRIGSTISISTTIVYSGKRKYGMHASQQIDGMIKILEPLPNELELIPGSEYRLSMDLQPVEAGELIIHPLRLSLESRFFRGHLQSGNKEQAIVTVGIGYAQVRSTVSDGRVKKYSNLMSDMLVSTRGGTDFYNIRPYVSGDELKNIDWVRSSKSGQLIVKEFEESHILPVFFLIDVDSSMDIGRNVSELNSAINLTANMANKLLMDNAMFGLVSFSRAGTVKFRPLGAGREHMALVKSILSGMTTVVSEGHGSNVTMPVHEADRMMKALRDVEGLEVLGTVLEETLNEQLINVKVDGFVQAITKASRSTGAPCQMVVITNLSMGIASLLNGIRIAGYYGHSVSVVLTPHIWYQDNELIDMEKFYEKYLEIKDHISRIRNMGRVKVVDLYSGERAETIIYKNVAYGPATGMRR